MISRLTPTLHRVRDVAAPYRLPLAAGGAVLLLVGPNLPWATFTGFPGAFSVGGFPPGGARLYPFVLSFAAVLTFVAVPGRRRALVLAAGGALAVTAFNVVAVTNDGGGLVNVGYGAWVTAVGATLLLVAGISLPDDTEPTDWPRLPAWLELLAVALSLGVLLYLVITALDIEEPSRFLSYLIFLGFGVTALARLGLFGWLSGLYERHRTITLTAAAVTAVAFPFTQGGEAYWLRVASSIGVFAAAAIGLNVVVGLAGLLDLGYIAFFGVGAYVGGLFADAALTTLHVQLPFLLVVLLGAVISAIFGVLIGAPTLRLRGDYLAIVTLGFGEIFRISANNFDGSAGPNITRGPNGIAGIPALELPSFLGGFNFGQSHELFGITLPSFANYYFAELVLLAFVILAFSRLNESRIGRAWVAIREDETAASAMGINTVRLKLLAFGIGAFLAGAAGTVNSHVTTQVSPDSYRFLESILLLAAVVLGGMGTVSGALLGSAALFVLPEKLRAFQDYRLLFFGVALVLMMRFRPEGMVPSKRRQREFHEEAGADASGAPPGAPVMST